MVIKKILYYMKWYVRCRIFVEKVPLNSSIILTDKCNLSCRHCVVAHLGYDDQSFGQVREDIEKLYLSGSRVLVITGGEPFLWRDKNFFIEDVVQYAKNLGFFRVVICTNGTFPLESKADYLWVSLDGFPKEHNLMRGDIYSQVVHNIVTSTHRRIYVNFTVSRVNAGGFEKAAGRIFKLKNVRGILFHLFTPYLGSEKNLMLNAAERAEVIQKIYAIKKSHPWKVFNTFDGIKALRHGHWSRRVWGSLTINQGELVHCCCRKGIYDGAVCENCGCTPAVETWVLQTAKPLALLENLRFL